MTNGFALNHDKVLQIYFSFVKCWAKNDCLKDVKSRVTKQKEKKKKKLFQGSVPESSNLTC